MLKISVYCLTLIMAAASAPAFADVSRTEKFGSGDCPFCTTGKSNSHVVREETYHDYKNPFEEKAPKAARDDSNGLGRDKYNDNNDPFNNDKKSFKREDLFGAGR